MKKEVECAFNSMNEQQQAIFKSRWLLHDCNSWENIAHEYNYIRRTIYNKREKILELYAMMKGEF